MVLAISLVLVPGGLQGKATANPPCADRTLSYYPGLAAGRGGPRLGEVAVHIRVCQGASREQWLAEVVRVTTNGTGNTLGWRIDSASIWLTDWVPSNAGHPDPGSTNPEPHYRLQVDATGCLPGPWHWPCLGSYGAGAIIWIKAEVPQILDTWTYAQTPSMVLYRTP